MKAYILSNLNGNYLSTQLKGFADVFKTFDLANEHKNFGGQRLFIGEIDYNVKTKKIIVKKWLGGNDKWYDTITRNENESPMETIDRSFKMRGQK